MSEKHLADVIAISGRWNGHWVIFKVWDVKQNFIPYIWEMVFAYVSVKGWIVEPYV